MLISGARGFIGAELSARLEAEGHVVHRVVRTAPKPGEVGIDLADATLDCSGLDSQGLDGIDAVVNLAGEPITAKPWGPKKRAAVRTSRIETTSILASALASAASPPGVFVSASAIGYYGSRGDELLVEGSRPGSGFLAEVCADWEKATSPARDVGIRVVTVRTGIVIGPGGGFLAQVLPMFRLGLGARLGSGLQWISWISLEDEVGAILHALHHEDLSGPLNATAPEPVRNLELTSAIAAAVERPALLRVPAIALELGLGHQNARDIALASQRVLPKRLESHGYSFRHPTLGDALSYALDHG